MLTLASISALCNSRSSRDQNKVMTLKKKGPPATILFEGKQPTVKILSTTRTVNNIGSILAEPFNLVNTLTDHSVTF